MEVAVKQYYVAVSDDSLKMPTLVDLLLALLADGPIGVVVSCSSRDALDTIVGGVRASVPQADVAYLDGNLLPEEREATLQAFADRLHQVHGPAAGRDGGQSGKEAQAQPGSESQTSFRCSEDPEGASSSLTIDGDREKEPQKILPGQVLVMTDVLFKHFNPNSLPQQLDLLIDFDLPLQKEVYSRQLQLQIAGEYRKRRIIIFFVVAGQISSFRALESIAAGGIDVMPVHVSDIFLARSGAGSA